MSNNRFTDQSGFEPIPSELRNAVVILAAPAPGARVRIAPTGAVGTSLGRDASGMFLVYLDSGTLIKPTDWEEVK